MDDQPNDRNDAAIVNRLCTLTDQLQERLREAEDVRARFTKAHKADTWPDMRLAAQRLADVNRTR